MRFVKPVLFLSSLSLLASCSIGGNSSSKDARRPASEAEYSAKVKDLQDHPYHRATLTAFYETTQNGQKQIDEQNKTCTYVLDERTKDWEIDENALGTYSFTFANHINDISAATAKRVAESFISQLKLSQSSLTYYVEAGLAIKLTGAFSAANLDSEASGNLSFALNLSFDQYGLLTYYDAVNQGTLTIENQKCDYHDHSGFVVAYAAE